ncbi:MAG: DUF4783 domain-containing protein [Bacteroidetes bacterium]|nr:DUF4783 domain-containing protein [Bacteroidota bacterium]
MKSIKTAGLCLLLILSSGVTMADEFDQVVLYLGSGNATNINNFFTRQTEIEFPDGKVVRSNPVLLEDALQKFMDENVPDNVKIIHRGPNGSRSFVIILYKSTNGKEFRVTLFMEGYDQHKTIKELKFENS